MLPNRCQECTCRADDECRAPHGRQKAWIPAVGIWQSGGPFATTESNRLLRRPLTRCDLSPRCNSMATSATNEPSTRKPARPRHNQLADRKALASEQKCSVPRIAAITSFLDTLLSTLLLILAGIAATTKDSRSGDGHKPVQAPRRLHCTAET